MNILEKIRQGADGVWRTLTQEELEEATEEVASPNRAMRRAQRLRNRPTHQKKRPRGQRRKWPHRAPRRRRGRKA